MAHTVKSLSAMQETRVRSLGREDLLEKGMATPSSILPGDPVSRGAWWVQSIGSQKVRHD